MKPILLNIRTKRKEGRIKTASAMVKERGSWDIRSTLMKIPCLDSQPLTSYWRIFLRITLTTVSTSVWTKEPILGNPTTPTTIHIIVKESHHSLRTIAQTYSATTKWTLNQTDILQKFNPPPLSLQCSKPMEVISLATNIGRSRRKLMEIWILQHWTSKD